MQNHWMKLLYENIYTTHIMAVEKLYQKYWKMHHDTKENLFSRNFWNKKAALRIITHHDKVIIAPAVKKGAHFTSVMLSNINFHVTSQIFCSSIFSTPPKSFLLFLHLLLFFMFSLLYHSTWNNDSNTYVRNKTHLFQIKLDISQIQNLWNSAFIKRLIFTRIYIQTFVNYKIWKSHKYKNVAGTMKRKYLGILYHIDRNVWMKKSHLKEDNLS